jgi:hypothetical protein
LLAALHESRSRQAAREIQYHQHLIDGARAFRKQQAIASARPNASGSERHHTTTGAVRLWPLASPSIKMTIALALLIIFGVFHIIGGALLERSVRSPGEAGTAQLSGD